MIDLIVEVKCVTCGESIHVQIDDFGHMQLIKKPCSCKHVKALHEESEEYLEMLAADE